MKVFVRRDYRVSWLLNWSSNGSRWYPINQRSVKPLGPFEALAPYREAMNRIYRGAIEIFEGDYDLAKKVLSLKKS
jgi:hypothetical protein